MPLFHSGTAEGTSVFYWVMRHSLHALLLALGVHIRDSQDMQRTENPRI